MRSRAHPAAPLPPAAPATVSTPVEPNPAAWDAFVLNHPQGHLLQLEPWGALKASVGWRVQRLALTSPAGALLAGAQVLFRQRYGVSVAYVPRGPLFASAAEPADPTVPAPVGTVPDDRLLATLEQAARQRRAVFLRIEPDMLEDDPRAAAYAHWLQQRGYRPTAPIQPRSSIHVDLTPPLERIFASLSKGHRADIRRAERQGVVVRVGQAADIAAFYAIMQETGQRADFGIHTADYYRCAWEQLQPRARLLLAEQAGEPVAAHLVFADARCGYYLYSGATRAGLQAGANHLLQWEALQWARTLGCRSYDLWGIPDGLGRAATATDAAERAALEAEAATDPLIGVYRFKKGFGGQVVRYLPAYDRVFLPPLYALWRRGFH